jgi:hypothetical protein
VDPIALNERVAAVEAAAHNSSVQHRVVIKELDRLAEHLVGENAPELQDAKTKIQTLIAQVAPERHDVTVYVQIYCHPSHA